MKREILDRPSCYYCKITQPYVSIELEKACYCSCHACLPNVRMCQGSGLVYVCCVRHRSLNAWGKTAALYSRWQEVLRLRNYQDRDVRQEIQEPVVQRHLAP